MSRLLEILLTAGGAIVLLGCLTLLFWREWQADELIDAFEDRQAQATTSSVALEYDPAEPGAPVLETGLFSSKTAGFQNANNAAPREDNARVNHVSITPRDGAGTAPTKNAVTLATGADHKPDANVLVSLPPDRSDWSSFRIATFRQADSSADRVVGVFYAPEIGIEAPLLQGTDDVALDAGLGWLEKTAFPGETGNAAIAGHRDSFFRRLGQLQAGDTVTVRTLRGSFSYRVTGYSIVEPADVSVLQPVSNKALLTLITCYPFRYVGSAPQRYIVHGELIDSA
ncbi:MAG: class D sortase [Gammaproteobacteria bacterium]|nr:class D sortase [Gammaproteobacteria bacterium]